MQLFAGLKDSESAEWLAHPLCSIQRARAHAYIAQPFQRHSAGSPVAYCGTANNSARTLAWASFWWATCTALFFAYCCPPSAGAVLVLPVRGSTCIAGGITVQIYRAGTVSVSANCLEPVNRLSDLVVSLFTISSRKRVHSASNRYRFVTLALRAIVTAP